MGLEEQSFKSYQQNQTAPGDEEQYIGKILKRSGLTLGIAESCTGGLISHRITNVPGSSDYFDRAVIAYSNRCKKELLGVKKSSLKKHGAVSRQVAEEMAKGIRNHPGLEIGLSSTGIAGPGGGTAEKPVGLVYIGLAFRKNTSVTKFLLDGNRWQNKKEAANQALKCLRGFASKIASQKL